MKGKSAALSAALLLAFLTARAAETESEAQAREVYLEALQLKLDHAARRANQPDAGSSSVIGLRGSRQEPLSKQLYWKGKPGSRSASPQEIREFRAAVEQARSGQVAIAIGALRAFLQKHPASPLATDVEDALRRLNVSLPGSPPDPVAEEPPPGA